MQKSTIFILPLLLILIIFGISNSIEAKEKPAIKKPNILLITVCSLRQDHLSCYGYPRLTSPNIDKLAETSTLFTNCYTHKPWTVAAIIALLTGKYPSLSLDISKEIKLTDLLHSVGYKIFGVMGTYAFSRARIKTMFDQFYDPQHPGTLETAQDAHTIRASVVVKKTIEILRSETINDSPIFLWVFFKDPHWKYLPPDPYKGLFIDDAIYNGQIQQLQINEDIYNSFGGIGKARLSYPDGRYITNKAYYISQYDAEIFFMDEHLGKLIEYMKSTDNFNDWLIIFTADHGESLGEDQFFFHHGGTISEGTIKIPFIIKMPGQTEQKVVNDLASICDIYPTIKDLLGIESDSTMYGESLSGILREQKTSKKSRQILFLENQKARTVKLRGCIFNSHKLVWNISDNEKKLYVLDGKERLVERYDSSQQKLIEDMTKFILDFFPDRPGEKQSENLEILRSLGYIQ